MAFFGLTALGPQSPFAAEYRNGFTCGIFELEEFASAYDEVLATRRRTESSAILTLADVPDVFKIVFHGPAPEGELDRAAAVFSAEGSREISMHLPKDLFLAGVEVLQSSSESDAIAADRAHAAHFDSFESLKEHRQRHIAPETGPADTFSHPLTGSQDIGWRAKELPKDPRYPKKHCAETKFAALLRASGYL